MKRVIITLGALLLGIGSVSASDRGRAREFFRQLDTNGDRQIQFGEIRATRARLFDRLDTNRNGILDESEIRTVIEQAQSQRQGPSPMQLTELETRGAALDRNGDRKISGDEFASFIPDRLLKADTNGDGSLSLRELRSLRRQ